MIFPPYFGITVLSVKSVTHHSAGWRSWKMNVYHETRAPQLQWLISTSGLGSKIIASVQPRINPSDLIGHQFKTVSSSSVHTLHKHNDLLKPTTVSSSTFTPASTLA